jgi:hypothetical protein
MYIYIYIQGGKTIGNFSHPIRVYLTPHVGPSGTTIWERFCQKRLTFFTRAWRTRPPYPLGPLFVPCAVRQPPRVTPSASLSPRALVRKTKQFDPRIIPPPLGQFRRGRNPSRRHPPLAPSSQPLRHRREPRKSVWLPKMEVAGFRVLGPRALDLVRGKVHSGTPPCPRAVKGGG